jgi:hypothetical protein
MPKRTDNKATATRGHELVAAFVRRAGGIARSVKVGRAPFVEISPNPSSRFYFVRVSTRSSGTWQTSTTYGDPTGAQRVQPDYWIFVDLTSHPVGYYVVPASWMSEDIRRDHATYLRRNNGKRARTRDSTHHKITPDRVAQWSSRWDLLGLAIEPRPDEKE